MIGETITIDGVEWEVVWSGGPLLPERETKPPTMVETTLDRRKYTRTGRHDRPKLDKPEFEEDTCGPDDEL